MNCDTEVLDGGPFYPNVGRRLARVHERCPKCNTLIRPERIAHYKPNATMADSWHFKCAQCGYTSKPNASCDVAASNWDSEFAELQKLIHTQPAFVTMTPSDLPASTGVTDLNAFRALLHKANVVSTDYQGAYGARNQMVTISGGSHTELDFIFDNLGNILEVQINAKKAVIE